MERGQLPTTFCLKAHFDFPSELFPWIVIMPNRTQKEWTFRIMQLLCVDSSTLTFFVWAYFWAFRLALHIDVWSDRLSCAAVSSRSPLACRLGRSRFLEGVQTQRVPFGWVHQFRGHTVHSFETFPLIGRTGKIPTSSQWQSITQHKAKIHKKNIGSILCSAK